MIGHPLTRIAKADDFRMRTGIVIDDISIHAAADDDVVHYQHGADRHLRMLALSATRQLQRLTHPDKVVFVKFSLVAHERPR